MIAGTFIAITGSGLKDVKLRKKKNQPIGAFILPTIDQFIKKGTHA